MTFLIIADERYALPLGETTLGGPADDVLRLSPLSALPPFAVVTSDAEGTAIRALAGGPAITFGTTPLGAEPRRVAHGECFTVGGLTVFVGDLRKGGRTAHVSGIRDDQLDARAALPGADATSDTGGSLTSLADGRAYAVPADGLVIGRDPDCDVVVASPQVSRRHARVVPGLLGYSVVDGSSNGLTVNGARVDGTRLLSQGDVIGVAGHEFRFTADAATYEPDASLLSRAPTPLMAPVAPREVPMPTEPMPAARRPEPAAPMLLATLEVTSAGPLANQRFRIERPAVQIGRGAQNDVALADDSVSTAHATLLQRDGAWLLMDLGSRNGSCVDGKRVTECALPGPCELTFGGVTLVFRPIASARGERIGTLGIMGLTDAQLAGRGGK